MQLHMYVGNLGLQVLIAGINISSIFLSHFVCVTVEPVPVC